MADIVLGPGQNIWLYYDPGREAWTSFITGHTSGGLSGGLSASANESITGQWTFSGIDKDGLKILDTDESHALKLLVGSNLTAARTLTLTTGDADRTLTISGSATVSQDYSTSGVPQFGGLGVGVAPSTLAHIKASTVNGAVFRIESTASNSDPEFQLKNDAMTWRFGNFGSNGDNFEIQHSGVGSAVQMTATTFEVYFPNTPKFGIGTGTPKSRLHLEGASSWIIQDEQDANPTTTELDANDSIAIYNKANTFVIAYNNGGTVTYVTLPLDGSTTTWTHSTTAP